MRRHARAGAGAARRRVRRGDERIGAVVDVEKRPLRALEQNVLASCPSPGANRTTVLATNGLKAVGRARDIRRSTCLERERLRAERFEHLVVLLDRSRQRSSSRERFGFTRSIMRSPMRAALSP